jgi:hypothetical protein
VFGAKAWLVLRYGYHENKGIDMQKLAVIVTALSILRSRAEKAASMKSEPHLF